MMYKLREWTRIKWFRFKRWVRENNVLADLYCKHVFDLHIYDRSEHKADRMICPYCGRRSRKGEKLVCKAEDFINKVPPEFLS